MTDRPIIFSGPMVRALLAGRKTQTRRLGTSPLARCRPDDWLWVRETWATHWACDDQKPREIDADLWSIRYVADDHIRPARRDGSLALLEQCKLRRPSLFMPRWASRLTLIVEAVRVEQLQAISWSDAEAEGVFRHVAEHSLDKVFREERGPEAVRYFAELWSTLHTKPGERWEDNPAVLVLTFRVLRGNIDEVRA